jgi:zinc protease
MSSTSVRLLVAVLLVAGCAQRPELPAPALPLTRTPDAAFRAQPPVPEPSEVPAAPEVREQKLANGVSVLVVERPSRPVATVMLVVRNAGRESAAEPRGLGALTARTLRFGTRLSDGRVVAAPALLGVTPQVVSVDDAVALSLETASVAVPEAVGLVASLATRPVFTDAGFSRAMTEHLDDIAVASRSARRHLEDAALERLYGREHPLSQSSLGRSGEVQRITLSQVRAFHAARYRPADMALVVVGGVQADRVFERAERELGGWTSDAPEAPREPAPAVIRYAGKRPLVAFENAVSMTTLLLAAAGPGVNDPDWYAFWLGATALSGSALSRGQSALSNHDVKSYGVGAGRRVRTSSSDVFVSFAVEHEDVQDSLETMLGLVDSLGDAPLRPEELARLRAGYLSQLTESCATNFGCAKLLSSFYVVGWPASELGKLRSKISAVTSADVQRAARKWLTRDRVQVAAVTDLREGGRTLVGFGPVSWYSLETSVTHDAAAGVE